MPKNDSDERKRNSNHHHNWGFKVLEPTHNQHINNDNHNHKSNSQIRENLQGNLPFSVPFYGKITFLFGLSHIQITYRITFRKLDFFESFFHSQNRISGTFQISCHISQNIDYSLLVFSADGFMQRILFYLNNIPNWNHISALTFDFQILNIVNARFIFVVQSHYNSDRINRFFVIQI